MRIACRLLLAAACAAPLAASGGALAATGHGAAPVVTQKGRLRVSVSGSIAPTALPRHGAAPVSVKVGGRISTTDGGTPPQLKELLIAINRHGRLDYAGLPTCTQHQIDPATSAQALAACHGALVGQGRFSADIVLAGQAPYPTTGRLLVFNGRSHGRPALLGQIYTAHPFGNSFVITFAIRSRAHGQFGTELVASLPKALGSWGYVTGISMTLSRRWSYRGARHSYVSAGCPAPKGFPTVPFPLARASFAFAGGVKLSSTVSDHCTVR